MLRSMRIGIPCIRGIDGDAAAIAVLQRRHPVDIGVVRQKLGTDACHRMRQHTGDAWHGRGDRQKVARPDRAVAIAKALKRLRVGRAA